MRVWIECGTREPSGDDVGKVVHSRSGDNGLRRSVVDSEIQLFQNRWPRRRGRQAGRKKNKNCTSGVGQGPRKWSIEPRDRRYLGDMVTEEWCTGQKNSLFNDRGHFGPVESLGQAKYYCSPG
ncbi:conserved hypothetical protein [Trichinella spiralis]|uniref:hypothetical protein n=1 Tax=Trichinella spiralis TaxID=6334 RepID=UPI0001EFE8E6|nr:conserved hypothetical protein [Trichinella spiralis]